MSKVTPKGPDPSLISGCNGRPSRVVVGKASECRRCKQDFRKGESCVAIPRAGSGFTNEYRVCDECYGRILQKTLEELDELRGI
jgi:hypothetical protein